LLSFVSARYPSSTVKRSLSMQRIQNPPDPNRLNSDYISCIENANTTLNVNFRKLLGAIERHSVLRWDINQPQMMRKFAEMIDACCYKLGVKVQLL